MACINSDGSLSASARAILDAARTSSTPEQLGRTTGLSLYRVRGGLRELVNAGLIQESRGLYQLTEAGDARLVGRERPA